MILLVGSDPVLNGPMQNFIEDLRDHLGVVAVAVLTVIILLPFVA
ncbi:MAG: hypothetical protein O3C68_00260 [Proteobacteria bacterium]|jgi:hypothetical protein|nr:hypothetical protein [Pseudomonadota bacterium]